MNQGRKKILFLITKATWGGAQRYVFDVMTNLPEEEYVSALAFGERGRLASLLEQRNIPTRQLPSLARDVAVISDIKSFFEIIGCIRGEKPDVIHLNSSKAAALGAVAARVCGIKKIVFTVHGWPFKEDRNRIAKALIRFISWFTALLSHAVIVVSKDDETIGKRMWLLKNKIHYIPIGIEAPNFLSREEASSALKISTNAPRIVTIAELTKNKGIAYAIEAFAKLKQQNIACEYFVIGDGELRAELAECAKELDVTDRVHFLGFVENAARYLKAFDIFLLPSIKEGSPYVLLEAGAAALPIVASDVGGIPDVIENDKTGYLCEQKKSEGCANALAKLTSDKTTRDNFGQNLQKKIALEFSLNSMLEKTLELYY